MSNPTTYLVKLTPLSSFFFGNEQGEKADYYLKGNNFPQQTALLGFVRHQLLIQNELIAADQSINDKQKSAKLIGNQSFRYDSPASFGIIEKLSPCFIIDADNKHYYPAPPPYANNVSKVGSNYFFPDFDPKDDYPLSLKPILGDSISGNDIFSQEERPGIDKPNKENIQEKSYFKQVWSKLKKGYGFGVYVTLDKSRYDNQINFDDGFATFGKESMTFKMEIAEKTIQTQENITDANAIVLLSDTYITEDILSSCEVAVTDTVAFRNVINETTQDKKKYHKIPTASNSVRLQLLKKGSVLFSAANLTTVTNAIDSHHNFKSIGYNHYQPIKLSITL